VLSQVTAAKLDAEATALPPRQTPPWVPSVGSAVFVFYALNIDTVFGTRRLTPYVYQVFGLLVVLLAAYIWRAGRPRRKSFFGLVTSPVILWALAYLTLCFGSLPYTRDLAYGRTGLVHALSTLTLLGTGAIAFAFPVHERRWNIGVVTAGVLTVACLSLFLDPLVDFRARLGFTEWAAEYERTRAGGLFFQPNIAGAAVAFLLAAIMGRTSRSVAMTLSIVALAAVGLTFSRSGLLLTTLVIVAAYICGYLPRLLTPLLLVICIAGFSWLYGSGAVESVFQINEGSGLARLQRGYDLVSREAVTSDHRTQFAIAAWKAVERSPLTGGGVGYSWYWADTQNNQAGTHNMILRFMLEYGIFGGFLWLLLLVALYKGRNSDVDKGWVVALLLITGVASMFSHNISEQGVILIPLMAAIGLPLSHPASRSGSPVSARSRRSGRQLRRREVINRLPIE
jgi:O-antigen ligase